MILACLYLLVCVYLDHFKFFINHKTHFYEKFQKVIQEVQHILDITRKHQSSF